MKLHPILTAEALAKVFHVREDGILCAITDYGDPCPVYVENLIEAFKFHIGIPLEKGKKHFIYCKQFKKGAILEREIKCLGFGVYAISHTGEGKYFCIDLDAGKHHKLQVLNLRKLIKNIYKKAKKLGLTIYLEKSKSCKGWHLWCFSSGLVPAKNLRNLAKQLLPQEIEVLHTKTGEVKVERPTKVIEIFPKQNKISETGVGSQVWLPFWFKCNEGSKFYDLELFIESAEERSINLEEVCLHEFDFEKDCADKCSLSSTQSKQYKSSKTGLFQNVISKCNALKRMWEKDEVSHMERVSLLAFALNTKTGLDDLMQRWRSDKTIEFIKYAKEREERPWTCKTLQEYGFCDPRKDALFEGQCMDSRVNQMGELVNPSPIRFAKTYKGFKGEDYEL